MANDNQPQIDITGNAEGFRRATQEAATHMRTLARDVTGGAESLASAFGSVETKLLAVGTLLGGGAFQSRAAEAVKLQTMEALKLSNALGITAEQANVLNTALGNVFLDSDTYLDGTRAVTKALNGNADGFSAMGIATRDAKGQLLPMQEIIQNTADALTQYKAGADRNVMANQLLGRSYEEVIKLARVNDQVMADAAQEVEDYHKQLDPAAVQAYREAMENLGDVVEGVTIGVGKQTMPVITQLANEFVRAQQETKVFDGAMAGIATVFETVVVVGANVAYVFRQIGIEMGGMAAQMGALLSGDFKAFSIIGEEMKADAKAARREIDDFSERILNARRAASSSSLPASVAGYGKTGPDSGMGTKSAFTFPTAGSGSKQPVEKQPSYMMYYEAALAEEKRLATERDANREYTKQQELAFWQELLRNAQMGAHDRAAAEKKASELIVEIARAEKREREQLGQEGIRAREAQALGAIDAQSAAAQIAVDLDQMTRLQQLQLEEQYEQQRYQVQLKALQERRAMLSSDPTQDLVAKAQFDNQMIELEQRYQIKRMQLAGQQQKEGGWSQMFQGMTQGWGQMLDGLATRSMSWSQALGRVWQNVRQGFFSSVAGMAQDWIGQQTRMLLAKLGFAAEEKAINTSTAATNLATKASEATGVVSANAAEAGSGAASAMSSIPYVGPILAIAAMGAMVAAVMGLSGGIKSASGGYDIPSGVNPLVQAHAEEMVLPKGPSNVMRQLADMAEAGQLGGGGGGSVTYNDHSGRLSREQIRENARVIASELNKLHRDGWRPA